MSDDTRHEKLSIDQKLERLLQVGDSTKRELDRINKTLDLHSDELKMLSVQVAVLQTKAGMWGGALGAVFGGIVSAIIGVIVWVLGGKT
jgi:hypothetical protein